MATKLFQEADSWGDTSANDSPFTFVANKKNKVKKKEKSRKRKLSEGESSGGKWVRAPKYYGIEDSEESPVKVDKNDRKRKHSKSSEVPEKKVKKTHDPEEDQQVPQTYQDKLRESLKGSRFRFINELLYTKKSEEAMKIFDEDETAYEAYHEGYRHQIAQWPMNPLDRIIKQIKKMPKSNIIVDMGCGDARLSKSVVNKVYSIDLVSNENGVIKADMSKVPVDSNSVNVVVYCLSLMGTNLKDFFIEANRILKLNGIVKIAEVSSRFEKVPMFIDSVQKCGFELVNKDLENKLFYFFTFKKTYDVNAFNKKISDFSLKPCLYKKR